MIQKIRAWDKVGNEMINYIISINFVFGYITFDTENVINKKRYFDDITIMQSTGLHDEQGVEIFEGDIVNVDRTFRNPMTGSGTLTLNKNFEVVFINGMFTRDGSSMGLSKDLKYLTVIGNVHQHPELLEAYC